MSLNINNSPDITLLSTEVIFDLSGISPVVIVNNLSQGPNLADVIYYFNVQSPTLTYIHNGSFSPPDESGVWTQSILSDPFPRPFNNIEFGIYNFQVFAKDSEGNEYAAPVQSVKICRPNGNLPTSQNPYGLGQVTVQTKCDQARIYFQDITNTSYQGLSGTQGSGVLRVNFPMDNTGTVPDPFEINYFSSAMVPITYSGKGYQFLYTSIWEYDFGDGVFVRIKYLLNDVFGVWCGIDLMPLICEFRKLAESIEDGSCVDANAATRKMNLINPKFALLMMGILQPLLGIDVPELIGQIEEIGDFDCNCCNVASGVLPQGTNAFEGYTFDVVSTCGDVSGEFVVNGYNIQLQLADISYIFRICDDSPMGTTAFTVLPSTDGCTKTYCLSVDMEQLAEDILNTIKTNAALVNLFNSIVSNVGGNFTLLVDGNCIFSTGTSCDYEITLSDIPVDTTFAIITGIKVASLPAAVSLNFSFNLTNLPALQAYLNGLGYGTFTVTNPSGQTVVISSANNTYGIAVVSYSIAGTNYYASIDSDCTGYTPLSANQVVQNIIDYLCSLNDAQVETSQAYEICYIDESGVKQTETIDAETPLADFLLALTTRGCTTIDYVVALGAVNCATIKQQFPSSVNIMQPNDYFLGTKGNACAQILPTEAFLYMLEYGQYNQDIITAFCAMVKICAGGNACEPYDVFYATVDAASPQDGTADLVITFSHPSAVSNTIRYARIDNTVSPVYITIPGVLPGESPYTVVASPGIENGQYRIGITPIYSDGRKCAELFYETTPCTGITAFSAVYDGSDIQVSYTAIATVPFVKVNISYPNGGSFTQIYANGATITITPPNEVYGTFFATMQPVCDNDSGWFGAATAQTSFEIAYPYTVLIQVENPLGGANNRIIDVTGIDGFALGNEVTEGNYFGGFHNEFTGAISVSIIQPGASSNGVRLYSNDVEIDCEDVTAGSPFTQVKTFISYTFAASDVIRIVYSDTACSISP